MTLARVVGDSPNWPADPLLDTRAVIATYRQMLGLGRTMSQMIRAGAVRVTSTVNLTVKVERLASAVQPRT